MSETEEFFRERTKNNICQPDLEKDKMHYEGLISFAQDFHADQVKKHNLVDGVKFLEWVCKSGYEPDGNSWCFDSEDEDGCPDYDIQSHQGLFDSFQTHLTNLANEVQDDSD